MSNIISPLKQTRKQSHRDIDEVRNEKHFSLKAIFNKNKILENQDVAAELKE